MTTILRPYQLAAVTEIRRAAAQGLTGVILQLPTGSGKTACFADILKGAHLKGRCAIMVVRGKALVAQASQRLTREGVPHGIYQGVNSKNTHERILVCSVDTLYARREAPQAELIVIDECFPPDVEILTNMGFIRFDRLGAERVAQFNQETRLVTFCDPIRHIKNLVCDAELVDLVSAQKIDLTTTAGHELLVRKEDGTHQKERAGDFKLGRKWFYKAGLADGPSTKLSSHEKLAIVFQADGHDQSAGRMHFSFLKQRKIDAFLDLMQEGAFEFSEIKGDRNKRRFSVVTPIIKSKFIDEAFNLEFLSLKKCRSIIDYMVMWDGSKVSENLFYYSSVEKRNTDFYQAVACLSGYATNQVVQKDERSDNFNDVHRLFIRKNQDKISTQKIEIKKRRYSGWVYCVQVPDGNIIVRRNGKPVVVGNCHLSHSDGYRWLLAQYPAGTFRLGVSATPHHKDGMRHIGNRLVRTASITELISQGYLVGGRYFVPYVPNLRGIKKQQGDFNGKELSRRSIDDAELTGSCAKIWDANLRGLSTLVYAVGVEHAGVLAAALRAKGARCEIITASTKDAERRDYIWRLENGALDALVSVGVLTTGVDIPSLRAILCCRPTESYNLWIQILGRGTRPFPGKSTFLVYDLSGNLLKHGPIESELIADLDGFATVAALKIKTCPACYATFELGPTECPACGARLGATRERKTGKRVHGLTDNDEVHEVILAPWELELPDLVATARERGYRKGWIYNMVKSKYGAETADQAWSRIRALKKWVTRERRDGTPKELPEFKTEQDAARHFKEMDAASCRAKALTP